MDAKRCHRIKVSASILGMDPGMLMATGITFALGCELFTNPFLALILACLIGIGVQQLRRNRMPGVATALCSYLFSPTRFTVLGRDRVPKLPDLSGKEWRRHAS